MQEVWKDIKDHEGFYQVSNLGNIKSLHYGKEKILRSQKNNKGYLRIQLKKKGISKRYFIHRLVANAFIPNLENKKCINHIDCNPLNNNVTNLEWCTYQENTNHMVSLNRNKRTDLWNERRNKSLEKYWKPVIQLDLKDNVVKEYKKMADVKLEGFRTGDVCKCCNGKRKTAGGYKWKYGRCS